MRPPGLICFDLDGTLYQDRAVYPRILWHFFHDTPYAPWIPELQSWVERVLRGEECLRCGQFVPKVAAKDPQCPADLTAVPSVTGLLERDPEPYTDRSRYTYLSEGWTLGMYLARRIGWSGEAFWERFQAVRDDLCSDAFGPRPDGELSALLRALGRQGTRLVLCSNAARAGGQRLLDRLALADCFQEVCFDAGKPRTFPARIAAWGLAAEEMLFIGDQGYYDLYAGKQAGAATLLLSPYHVEDACLWDRRLWSLDDLKAFLSSLLD